MLQGIVAAARRAGDIMLAHQHAAVRRKDGHYNFVTDADLAVQQYLSQALPALLPGARFFSEEQENDPLTGAPTFVVDPIDGTLNFMRGRRASAVSIALLENRQPVLGAVYDPAAAELFTAEAGRGAFLNGQPISVSSAAFANALVILGTSPYHPHLAMPTMAAATQFLLRAGDLRRSGAAALDLCGIACGRADIYFELILQSWDTAAGCLIVKEAGGCFLSLGRDAPWFEGPCGILACAPSCLEGALQILKEAEEK